MNPVELMEGFTKRLKAAEKELSSLEKKAQKLADKQAEVNEQRASIRADIAKHKGEIESFEQEDSQVKNGILEAMLSDDTSSERTLKQRRKQIAGEVEEHKTGIRKLQDALDNLEDTEQASAEIAAKLDMLNFGYAFGFGSRLRDALVSNELRLKSKQSTARHKLPSVSGELVDAARRKLDDAYAKRQDAEQKLLNEHQSKREQEQAKKDAAAREEYVGVGAFGGKRRIEPDSRDFSNHSTA